MTQPSESVSGSAESIPRVLQADLAEIPEVGPGTEVTVTKIDLLTGEQVISQVDLNGKVWSGQKNMNGVVGTGLMMYVRPTDTNSSNHTSVIERIDQMSDGSYWLHTRHSVYRLVIGKAPNLDLSGLDEEEADGGMPVIEADRERGDTPVGAQRVENRGWLSRFFRRGK